MRSGSELADVHWLWMETGNKLESYRARVREGKDLDAAAEFAKYVQWSGLIKLLAPHDNQGCLKVDSTFLRWTADDLLREVQDLWASGKIVPGANQPQLEAINHKLDLIAAAVSQAGVTVGGFRPHVVGCNTPRLGRKGQGKRQDAARRTRASPNLVSS